MVTATAAEDVAGSDDFGAGSSTVAGNNGFGSNFAFVAAGSSDVGNEHQHRDQRWLQLRDDHTGL